jgi:hypothetical protein
MKPEDIVNAFRWPESNQIPLKEGRLYKHDPLLAQLENLIPRHKAWAPIIGSTKRTEPEDKLNNWLVEQNQKKLTVLESLNIQYSKGITLDEFPHDPEKPTKRIITTSTNIAYIIDKTIDFLNSFKIAFGKNGYECARKILCRDDIGVFVYVTNSVESGGRAFSGDPFTGQAAAYSRIFAHDLLGEQDLYFVAYYPHQLFTQFFDRNGAKPQNKGVRMLSSQADLIISDKGVLIEPEEWKIYLV